MSSLDAAYLREPPPRVALAARVVVFEAAFDPDAAVFDALAARLVLVADLGVLVAAVDGTVATAFSMRATSSTKAIGSAVIEGSALAAAVPRPANSTS